MSKFIADANYVLRWFLDDVPEQSKIVEKFLKGSLDNIIYLDRISIAEITYVLRSKGYDHKQVTLVITEFCRYTSVESQSVTDSQALDLYKNTVLDFEDCWLVAYAQENNVDVATFDKKLQKIIDNKT